MKKRIAIIKSGIVFSLVMFLLILTGCSSSGYQSNSNETTQAGYNLDDLNNYGEWVNVNGFGNAWRPYAVSDWMPFDNGHWAYADGEWTWISYEPFGWIVYHYGNWYDDPFYGWVWIPSNDPWSPARVMWINYDDYVGWAPLPPAGVSYGKPWEEDEHHPWHVVRHKDFTEDNVREYRVVDPVRNETGGRDVLNKPPDREQIEKSSGGTIENIKIGRQTINLPERQINKMDLPPQEKTRVDQNSSRVKTEVLIPKDEFKKRQNDTSRESKDNNRKK